MVTIPFPNGSNKFAKSSVVELRLSLKTSLISSSRPIKKPVWNNIDAIGLLNGISIWDEQYQKLKYVRIPDETNIELRHKINNFRDNPVDGTIDQQLIIGLANELNLDSYKTLNVNTLFALAIYHHNDTSP